MVAILNDGDMNSAAAFRSGAQFSQHQCLELGSCELWAKVGDGVRG